MSKITPILAGAALAAAIGAWNSPSARADLNIGLYTTSGASTASVSGGGTVTIDVIATFTNGATGTCGIMDLDGIFTASASGGAFAAPTLGTNLNGVASAVGIAGATNGGWGVDSYTGSTPNFMALRSSATAQPTTTGYVGGPVLAPMSSTVTVGSVTGVLLAQIVYTAPSSGSVNLAFAKNTDAGYPSAIWVQNMGWSNSAVTITGGMSDTGGGVVTTSGLAVSVGATSSAVWTAGSGSDVAWSTPTNWSGNSVPTVDATFNGTDVLTPSGATSPVSLTTANTNINTVTFSSQYPVNGQGAGVPDYTISPSVATNTLTVGATAAGAITVNSAGTHGAIQLISAKVVLGHDTSINVNNTLGGSPATLTLSGGINGGGHNLTVNGSVTTTAGTVVLGGASGGEITNLNSVTVSDGTLKLAPITSSRAAGGSNNVVVMNSLTLGANATFDLSNRDIVIHNAASQYGTYLGLLASGFNGGSWDGKGIISSQAPFDGNTCIGIVTGDEYLQNLSTFDGVNVVSSDLLLKYTFQGDLNLDGVVDDNDLFPFLNSYTGDQTGDYFNGDNTYDNTVDDNDLFPFLNNYTADPAVGPLAKGGVVGLGSVPEPASLLLVGLGALAMFGRRSRKQM